MAKKDKIGRSILASFIAALGSISFGYCMGHSSSALVDLTSPDTNSAIRLTGAQGSWFSSLVAVGAIFGRLVGEWAIDKFGRKRTLLLCSVPFELGWLLISFAQNRPMLYAGRISTGLACGIVSLATPIGDLSSFLVGGLTCIWCGDLFVSWWGCREAKTP